MAGPDRLRNQEFEARLFRGRTVIAALGVTVLVLVLLGRLFYLQFVSHDHYSTLSNDNRVRLQAVAPTRGLIRDRDGRLLAQNLPSFSLQLIPERVDDLEATLAGLRPLVEVDEREIERLREAWPHARPFEGVPLRFRLTPEEVARVSVNRHRFPGVDIVAGLTRSYPHNTLGVHALGYVGRIDEQDLERLDSTRYRATTHTGKLGVEYQYESLLQGQPGVRRVEVNAQGRVLRTLAEEPATPGRDLRLSLDLELQRLAEKLLGERDGAAVVLDPRDGQVLALASTPTFDSNEFVNGIGREQYAALRDSPHRPLFNRAIRGQYPPGSTVKPMIALNGLVENVRRRDEVLNCRGFYRLDGRGRRYRDWKVHGKVDLADSITQSCDVMYYDLALRLGMGTMAEFLRRFGLGSETGIDLPGERDGLVPDAEWKRRARNEPWYTGETLIHGIGQGYMQTTPVQLATAAAVIANRGEPVRPHLFLRAGDQPPPAEVTEPVIPPIDLEHPEDWDYVIDAMIGVTQGEKGTARAIGWRSPNTIAGKTGTAQVYSLAQDEEYDEETVAAELRDHALFIAFAPADQPRVAVAVVIEHGGSGSSAAAPVAQQLIDAWLGPPEEEAADDA